MSVARTNAVLVALASLAVLALPAALAAQEPPHPQPREASAGHEAHEGQHEHANDLGLFLGGTAESDETHFTLGAEYERRLAERLGLAVVVEHVDGIDAWVFVAPFTFRPARHLGLKLYAGPGFETKEREPEGEHEPAARSAAEEGGSETFFVFRTGVGWAVRLGRVSLTPQVELDFARERDEWKTAVVFGVALGLGF